MRSAAWPDPISTGGVRWCHADTRPYDKRVISRRRSAVLVCLIAGAVAASGVAAAVPQRMALVVVHVVDGSGEPVEGVEVRLVRCRGARRYTRVPSFELANPSGVPVETGNDRCDVFTANTRADGTASIPSIPVGEASVLAPRDSRRTYLLRAVKPGYTRVRRLVTPHVARNDFEFVVYRTVGERMFELIDEAQAATLDGGFAAAEAAMTQAVAMMSAEIAVRGMATPDVLLESMRFLAYVQMAGGNEIAAHQTLDELLGLAPGDVYALRASGVLAVRNRDWPLARSHFATYVQLNPDSADAQLMMGNLMLETSEVAAALEHLERSVELDPTQAAAYRSLGKACEQAERFEEAVENLQRYLELAGDPPDALQIRATIELLRRSPQNVTM